MISRRLLRVKGLQILYSFFANESATIERSEKELHQSIDKTYELYNYILLLLVDIVNYADNKISVGKDKYLPTQNELFPNTKFIENKVIKQIRDNRQFSTYLRNSKISWTAYPVLIRKLYATIVESGFYKKYLNSTEKSFEEDKELVIKSLKFVIGNSEELYQTLEELSIFWNDDIEYVISIIVKIIKNMEEGTAPEIDFIDPETNSEDMDFAHTLFRKTILGHNENKSLIERFAKNWDVERIASIDILILEMAIVEITEIVSIPVKVSFNEYIEISKFYSTDKSSNFINGILDKIINHLQEENLIKKRGRGLIKGKKKV